MHATIFDTPIVKTLLRWFSVAFLSVTGWRVTGALPSDIGKCVLIAAPHTSNWDLPYTLMTAYHRGLRVYWMGKASIFRPPFRHLMMWLGGIPVHRERSGNLVAASILAITEADHAFQLVVPPEGTRDRVREWKTGFYYIALGAKVPIVLAYMDYERKLVGIGPVVHPSGDIEADMKFIKAYYAPFRGKNADQFEAV